MTRATTEDLVRLKRHGFKVERWANHGWVLLDPDGAQLMIGDHGCIAPRQVDAVAEGLERIRVHGYPRVRCGECGGTWTGEHHEPGCEIATIPPVPAGLGGRAHFTGGGTGSVYAG